jgi:hypothetical protein
MLLHMPHKLVICGPRVSQLSVNRRPSVGQPPSGNDVATPSTNFATVLQHLLRKLPVNRGKNINKCAFH